jgi:hypothetical protein
MDDELLEEEEFLIRNIRLLKAENERSANHLKILQMNLWLIQKSREEDIKELKNIGDITNGKK